MKVLGLVGSPRKGSNTDLLVTRILEGAEAGGGAAEKVYLYDLDILPCLDCRTCKSGNFECSLNDDMKRLYAKLEAADVIVFGTPLYWYGSTAKMKLLVDRLRPYIASKRLSGKKGILVAPSEEGASACRHLVGMFELSFRYLEMDLAGQILDKAYERAEVKEHPLNLEAAFQLGKSLV